MNSSQRLIANIATFITHARREETVDGLRLEDTGLVGCADERVMLNRVGRRWAKGGETPIYVSAKAAEVSKSRQYEDNELNSDLRGVVALARNLKRASHVGGKSRCAIT